MLEEEEEEEEELDARRWRGGRGGGDCLAKEPLTTYDHVIN